MAKVDAVRFIKNLQELFAPSISDNQEFTAYIDGQSNEIVIQGDNIINASSGGKNVNSADVQQLLTEISAASRQLAALQSQADNLENLCRSIPVLQTQLSTLSGDTGEGEIDFEWASIREEIADMTADISSISGRVESLEDKISGIQTTVETLDSYDSYSDSSSSYDDSELKETITGLENRIDEMQETINNLSLEIHGQVTSETEYDVS